MICSILVPTRKRIPGLHTLFQSILDCTSRLDNIEVLLYVDDDDTATIEYLEALDMPFRIRMCIGPRPQLGYAQLFELYNELCTMAVGEFVWILNDDATIDTTGWDNILRRYTSPCVIHCQTSVSTTHTSNIFPIVHRSIPSIVGSLGLHTSIDVQYELLVQAYPELYKKDFSIFVTHHFTGVSQHVIDNLPPTDPGQIHAYRGVIQQHANQLRSYYETNQIRIG